MMRWRRIRRQGGGGEKENSIRFLVPGIGVVGSVGLGANAAVWVGSLLLM